MLPVEQLKTSATSERVNRENIVTMGSIGKRGVLAMRVRPDGLVVGNEILLITGSYVSGRMGDPDSIKGVYARPLNVENGMASIPDGESLYFDPDLTAVKIGEIDYMDVNNKDFFSPLGTGM